VVMVGMRDAYLQSEGRDDLGPAFLRHFDMNSRCIGNAVNIRSVRGTYGCLGLKINRGMQEL
jgi:hypothetical protein